MARKMNAGVALSAAVLSVLFSSTAISATPDAFPAPQSDRTTWYKAGRTAILNAKAQPVNARRAKNVILFIGDGMGVSTVTAARILAGQQPGIINPAITRAGSSGEENYLSFEKFPNLALSKTYSVNQQTSDSAPTMTAMVTGIKTNDGELSVAEEFVRGSTATDCNKDPKPYELTTILELAEDAKKSTGVVSTARITHATPAANYAHTTNRDWEADSNQPAAGCVIKDIASQLVDFKHGDGIDVILGGGRTYFMKNDQLDPEYGKAGRRKDGRDLIAEWTTKTAGNYVWNKGQFDAIDPASTSKLFGLFENSHMQYEADRNNTADKGEPNLADMTEKAIHILKKNPKGFYLQVEGGRIDHGHHAGNAYRALTDTIAMSDAVQRTMDVLKANKMLDDTLIIVSADHSHTFTIAGYPQRGNNILGKVIEPGKTTPTVAADSWVYTTLGYANGGGFAVGQPADAYTGPANTGRSAANDLASVDTTDKDFHQQALVNTGVGAETHAGEDVAIYARGPWAHLVRGTQEQNYIFHVMYTAFGFR